MQDIPWGLTLTQGAVYKHVERFLLGPIEFRRAALSCALGKGDKAVLYLYAPGPRNKSDMAVESDSPLRDPEAGVSISWPPKLDSIVSRARRFQESLPQWSVHVSRRLESGSVRIRSEQL